MSRTCRATCFQSGSAIAHRDTELIKEKSVKNLQVKKNLELVCFLGLGTNIPQTSIDGKKF